jgi:hypothetical protein
MDIPHHLVVKFSKKIHHLPMLFLGHTFCELIKKIILLLNISWKYNIVEKLSECTWGNNKNKI